MGREHWNLEPNNRINGIEFGRDCTLIRQELGEPIRTFEEYGSHSTVEVYPSFHIHYSAKGKMEAMEFFGGDVTVSINSQQVFPGTLSTVQEILPDLQDCFGSYISKAASVGVTAEDGKIKSLLAGCKNYYK